MACRRPDRRIVAAGGFKPIVGTRMWGRGAGGPGEHRAEQWVPGTEAWTALPDLPESRWCAASVVGLSGRPQPRSRQLRGAQADGRPTRGLLCSVATKLFASIVEQVRSLGSKQLGFMDFK